MIPMIDILVAMCELVRPAFEALRLMIALNESESPGRRPDGP